MRPPVSIIVAARDEVAMLPGALAAALAQDYPGEIEVVVADGSAGPHTTAAVRARFPPARFPRLRLVANPGRSAAAGLNRAAAAARHAILVRCDARCRLPPGYVGIAVDTLLRTGAVAVGGRQRPAGTSAFTRAVALAMTTPLGAGDARYRIGGPEGPADTVWLGVYRRDALQAAGGFDESLLRNQDYALHWRLRQRGGTVWFTPALQAEYRPRATLAALARQYWDWGRWKRAMVRRHPGSLRWRQLAAPALTAALAASSLAAPLAGPVAAAVPLAYLAALALGAVACGLRRRSAAAVLLPAVLATMHLAWGAGFWAACLRPPGAEPEPEGAGSGNAERARGRDGHVTGAP